MWLCRRPSRLPLSTTGIREGAYTNPLACAESLASEHASRLGAMQAAERNLDERLEQVTGEFRRARQGAITAELLEVVSGFEATIRAPN